MVQPIQTAIIKLIIRYPDISIHYYTVVLAYPLLTGTDKPQCTYTATGVQFLQKLYCDINCSHDRAQLGSPKIHCHSNAFMTRYCKQLYGMVNAYARGTVEVLYMYGSWCGRGTLEERSRYARGAVEVRSRCGRGTLEVRSRYARGAVEVRSRYGRGTVEVRSRYARGAVEVRSRCGRGTLLVRFRCASGSLRVVNFLTGVTVFGDRKKWIPAIRRTKNVVHNCQEQGKRL